LNRPAPRPGALFLDDQRVRETEHATVRCDALAALAQAPHISMSVYIGRTGFAPASTMKIGSIAIPQLCRLAPMAAISNAPFRLIAKECGSGLTTTEEIDAFAILMDTPRAGDMAAYDPQERPLAMQLLGRDPQALIRAAYRCEELGADIVDLNMGCPMPKITGKGKGAALMRDVPGTARLLRAMRQTITVPFTIKIRGGWDDEHLNAVEVARMAESEGVDAITVHPRTRSQRFTGKAPWTIIAEVVEAVRIPVTGNGDVDSMATARRMVGDTGCQSVMVGRGALGRPWIFDDGFDALTDDAQREYKDRVIRRHMDLIQEQCFDRYALSQMKKHLAWYTDGLAHATDCRARIFQTKNPAEVWEVFQEYWEASARGAETATAASV
jgi:tRNA-dihydrouridine synthase B